MNNDEAAGVAEHRLGVVVVMARAPCDGAKSLLSGIYEPRYGSPASRGNPPWSAASLVFMPVAGSDAAWLLIPRA